MRPNAVQRQPRRRHAGRGGSLGDLKLKMREGMRSPPARSRADYFFKVHKPSARQGEARAGGRAVGGPPGAIAIAGACGGEGGSPAPAGARSEALQGRLQSLVREELNEDFLFSSALRCRPMIVAGDDPI